MHLETRTKELISKCVTDYISNQPKTINKATSNAMKRSSISEHLIKNTICEKYYNGMKFRILRNCNNTFDLIKF